MVKFTQKSCPPGKFLEVTVSQLSWLYLCVASSARFAKCMACTNTLIFKELLTYKNLSQYIYDTTRSQFCIFVTTYLPSISKNVEDAHFTIKIAKWKNTLHNCSNTQESPLKYRETVYAHKHSEMLTDTLDYYITYSLMQRY